MCPPFTEAFVELALFSVLHHPPSVSQSAHLLSNFHVCMTHCALKQVYNHTVVGIGTPGAV